MRADATFRLGITRKQHPELVRAEAQARLLLAGAIMRLDKAAEDGPAIEEQTAVEQAMRAYGDALADLVRAPLENPLLPRKK